MALALHRIDISGSVHQPATTPPACFELMTSEITFMNSLFCLPCHVSLEFPQKGLWGQHGILVDMEAVPHFKEKHLGIFDDIWSLTLLSSKSKSPLNQGSPSGRAKFLDLEDKVLLQRIQKCRKSQTQISKR